MATPKKLLEALINVLFAKTPAEAVKIVLKTALDQIDLGPAAKTWEQLYVDALQAAVQARKAQLQHYASADGEIRLDTDRLLQALRTDLPICDLAESDLRSDAFLDELVDTFVALDALIIGGHQLTRDETRQVIELVVRQTAPKQFAQIVEQHEEAFRQALHREAIKHSVQLDVVQSYLEKQFALSITLLVEIDQTTKAIDAKTDKIIDRLDGLPGRIVEEMEARAETAPPRAARPQPRTVFISYARADHADAGRDPDCFVQKLYRALQAEGFIPWLDHHDMPSRGTPFPKELALAIEQSERFLAVCGPAYPASDWCRAERDHAHALCLAITPVLFAGDFADGVPADLDRHNCIDMRAGFERTWPDLLKRLQEPAAVPGKLAFTPGDMPEQRPTDLPRPALFDQVKGSLRADQTDPVTISGTRALTAMYAAGGIGKSTLAAQIARDCEVRRGFPDGVAWIRLGETVTDPETLRIMVGAAFGIPADSLRGPAGQFTFVQQMQNRDALIVLDDVWSLAQVDACRVQGPDLRYLITTRRTDLGESLKLPHENRIKMDYLTVDEGVELIARRLGLDPAADYPHKDTHRQIVETLGRHTQAIDLAAAHLRPREEGGSGPDYAPTLLAQFQKGDDALFELLMRSVDDESREGNLLKSLSVSYEMLPVAPVDLQRCFRLLGVFAPGSSFDAAAAAALWQMDDLERARRLLNDLTARSLLIPTQDSDRWTLHALIHAAARVLLAEHGQDSEAAAAAAGRHLAHYLALMRHHDDAGTYPQMLPELPQLKQAFAWAHSRQHLDLMLALLSNSANLLRQFGGVRDQVAWAEACVTLARQRNDPEALGQALVSRGNAYSDLATVQGEDRRARLLQALADYDEALDLLSDVPLDKATTLNNRATVYSDLATVQGEDRRARLLQALADYDEALDLLSDVPLDKAATLNNRATVYSDLATVQGEDRRARLLQALADYDEALDPLSDVPLDKATTLNNRATVYSALATVQGEDRRAQLLQALADYDEALDLLSDVPLDYAMTQGNLGYLYTELGDDAKALAAMWAAAQGFEQVGHGPYIAQSRQVLVGFRNRLGDAFDTLWADVIGQPLPEWLHAVPPVSLTQEEAQRLAGLLIAWVQTPDWGASEAYLREHAADLLTDAAEAVMQMLIQGNPGRQELEQRRALLRACREQGIEAAYELFRAAASQNPLVQGLLQFLQADSDEEARAVLLAQPELLLSDDAAGELEKFQGGDEASQARVARRKALWQQVRQERGTA